MEENTYNKQDCPFESWMLMAAYTVVKQVHKESDNTKIFSSNGAAKDVTLWNLEDYLFNTAYDKVGAKPIGRCSIEELKEELKRRIDNENQY